MKSFICTYIVIGSIFYITLSVIHIRNDIVFKNPSLHAFLYPFLWPVLGVFKSIELYRSIKTKEREKHEENERQRKQNEEQREQHRRDFFKL